MAVFFRKNERVDRKKRSENYLRKMDVPVNIHLPYIETEDEIKLRTVSDIVKRAYVLEALCAIGHDVEKSEVIDGLKSIDKEIVASFSPKERELLESTAISEQQKIELSWKIEGTYLLLWSINVVRELPHLSEMCDTSDIDDIMYGSNSYDSLMKKSKLRSKSEILDASDLIYRAHWAVVDAGLNGAEFPAGMNPYVIYERHYVINWLTYYNEEWDDITTDT
jgi:hypothetical protein